MTFAIIKAAEADITEAASKCPAIFGTLLSQLTYRAMTLPAKGRINRARSTGYEEVLKLLFSGLCSRIDVFGLTANCGGYYHEREHVMSVHHSCELESWSLHHIMRYYKAESSRLCVWI